jgi:hypothetical protein
MVRPRCWLDVATFDFFGQALRDDALSTLRKLGKLLHEETEIHVLSFSAECLQLADFVAKVSLRHRIQIFRAVHAAIEQYFEGLHYRATNSRATSVMA